MSNDSNQNSAPRVLIVDDDMTIRISLKTLLEADGFKTEVADSAEAAIEILDTERYPIVISDWEMPGMSGIELCKRVRESTETGYTYFFLLTSHSDADSIVLGLEAGADDFITKPYNPAELRVRMGAAQRIMGIDTRDVTIFALAKLAESRDPETGAHLERVRAYSRDLAEHLRHAGKFEEIDHEFVRLVFQTSPLHDIGKVAIPDSVLLKPGQLTNTEFEIMKSHTTAGAETLGAALERYPEQRFLKLAHEIALSHHERWDGSGYPNGLVGEEIPVSARVMAVADVYDALTSKRVYKDAFSHEVATSIITESSGTHFDPVLVDAFMELNERFYEIRKGINDEHDGDTLSSTELAA